MSALLALLRVRPVWVMLLCGVLSLLSYATWPHLVPGDSGRRGVLVVVGLALLWTLIEWIIHMGRQLKEQKTRRGRLGLQLRGALLQLAREHSGDRTRRTDAVLALPWVLLVGPPKAGKSQLLEGAGLRRVTSCGDEGGATLCSFWLAEDAGQQSVFLELSGAAFADHEACSQIVRWLQQCRGGPDAILLLLSLSSLWGSSGEQAHALAVECSSGIRRILNGLSDEVMIHIAAHKCDCIDGLTRFFPQADSRPFGFQINRPLHSGLPREFLTERMTALIEALWDYRSESLELSRMPIELEPILDFPREARRHGELLCQFVSHYAAQFSPDTRARLGEVYLTSALPQLEGVVEAARIQRLRDVPAQLPPPPESQRATYFVRGALKRITRQAQVHTGPRHSARQGLWLWAGALLCVIGMAAGSRVFFARRSILERTRQRAEGLARTLDEVHRGSRAIDLSARATVADGINQFLEREQHVAKAALELEQRRQRGELPPLLALPLLRLYEAAEQYQQCRMMHRLVWPLVRYSPVDEASRKPQPVFDRLRRLGSPVADRQRRAGGAARADSALTVSLSEWLEALYATALIRRRASCINQEHDSLARWMGQYFSRLWPLDPALAADVRGPLEKRLSRGFKRYLDEPADSPGLAGKLNTEMLQEAQQALRRPSELDSRLGGDDPEAALEWALRVHEYLGRKDVRATPYSPRLSFFLAEHPVPPEFTRVHCNRLDQDRGVALRWLACLRDVPTGNLNHQGSIEKSRLAEYYRQRSVVVWSEFMAGLGRRVRSGPSGANPLADMADDLPRLSDDLRVLFTGLGIGEKTSEPLQDLCRAGAQSFAPFRWAVAVEEEGGGASSQELQDRWREYSGDLTLLRERLVALARPPAPVPRQAEWQAALAADEALGSLATRRERWITALRDAAQPPTHAAIARINDLVKRFEDDMRSALRERMRRIASCLFAEHRSWWSGQLLPTGAAREQVAEKSEAVRGQLRQKLSEFLDGVLARPSDLRPELAREVRGMLSVLNLVSAPREGAATTPPTMIPVPDSRCGNMRILRITLDVPELQRRFVCDVSGGCLPGGPNRSQAVELRVQWAEGGTSEVQSFASMRELLARSVRTTDRSAPRLLPDPLRHNQLRHRVDIPMAGACRSMNPPRLIHIYLDEAVAQRYGASQLPRWMEGNFFDAATASIERCQ